MEPVKLEQKFASHAPDAGGHVKHRFPAHLRARAASRSCVLCPGPSRVPDAMHRRFQCETVAVVLHEYEAREVTSAGRRRRPSARLHVSLCRVGAVRLTVQSHINTPAGRRAVDPQGGEALHYQQISRRMVPGPELSGVARCRPGQSPAGKRVDLDGNQAGRSCGQCTPPRTRAVTRPSTDNACPKVSCPHRAIRHVCAVECGVLED